MVFDVVSVSSVILMSTYDVYSIVESVWEMTGSAIRRRLLAPVARWSLTSILIR